MLDPDTFLITLYVFVDDFCKASVPPREGPGRKPSLSVSEVITLALFAQFQWFRSETQFYRWACRRLRHLFPGLPHRSQFNRQVRAQRNWIVAFFRHVVDLLDVSNAPYQALDSAGVPTRGVKRRGQGWLPGQTDIGWSNRHGWYHGFHVLQAISPEGIVTGFGFSSASVNDHPLAETFFALRAGQPSGYWAAVGSPATGPYLADSGFAGQQPFREWKECYQAVVIAPPQKNQHQRGWTAAARRQLASWRQIVETVYSRIFHFFGLEEERPHAMCGFQARLAAKMCLHDFCIWLNRQLGRANLAFADLIDW